MTAERTSLMLLSARGSRRCAVPAGAALLVYKRTERFEHAPGHSAGATVPLILPSLGPHMGPAEERGRWASLRTPAVIGALL